MDLNIKNVVLVVADAVRYDYACEELASFGPTYKTVAPSLHTASSFASLLTGRHVPDHGVTGFDHSIPESMRTLFDLEGLNTAVDDRDSMNDTIEWITPGVNRRSLEEMTSSFLWMSRTPGGHAPYNGFDMETFDFKTETGAEYLQNNAGYLTTLRSDYEKAIQTSIKHFEEIMTMFESIGELEETLFIYTSDHGEALGERGYIGHNHLAHPEIVYVPTTFVHPSLSPGKNDALASSVDIYTTICDVLRRTTETIPEDSHSLADANARAFAYNYYKTKIYGTPILSRVNREVDSVWDADGGWVFNSTTRLEAAVLWLGLFAQSAKGKHMRRDGSYREVLMAMMPGEFEYGSPIFDRSSARRCIEQQGATANSNEKSLGGEQKEQLEDLGYL